MDLELRLVTLERLDEALELPVDAIGVGQEGCFAKMPSTEDLRTAAGWIRASGRSAVVVAPIAWPRSADALVDRLRAVAADGPTTIAVNDLGTLLALADTAIPHLALVAGLGLTRARPHGAATGPANTAPPPAAFVDTALFEMLSRHGIGAVEIDPATDHSDVGERWQVRRYVDAVPLGYGRSCPTARQHRTGPPDCVPLCNTPYTLTTTQRWQLNHGHREPLPAGTAPPQFTVWGNTVYQPVPAVEPTAGYRIIDARWHPGDGLAATVEHHRNAVPVPAGR